MTETPPFCFSCYVSQLQQLANEFGHQLQPVIPATMNLPTEYHVFFLQLQLSCIDKINNRKWEQLPEIDQASCQYTLVALKEVLEKLIDVGMEPKSEQGHTKMISFMRQTVNLINLLTSISEDI